MLAPSSAEKALAKFDQIYEAEYLSMMRKKLGLPFGTTEEENVRDRELILTFFETMTSCATDFTAAFQALTAHAHTSIGSVSSSNIDALAATLADVSANPEEFISLLKKKMNISRISMPPQQIEGIWSMCEKEPTKIEQMFNAPVSEIRREIMGEKKKLDRLVTCTRKIEVIVDST